MKTHQYFVYILMNKNNTVMYTGVTNNLLRRIAEHKSGNKSGFTKRYNVNKLVYYEMFLHIQNAIEREKELKRISTIKKHQLIDQCNPMRLDLFDSLL